MSDELRTALERACNELGVEPKNVPTDGIWHPANIVGDATGQDDARIKLFPDGHGGIVRNWKTSESKVFFIEDDKATTSEEREARRIERERRIREAEAEEQRRHVEAREEAAKIWQAATPATDDHPYLVRKGVKAHGLRVHHGRLLIPVRDDGELHSLHTIGPNGDKLFLLGGRVKGCYFGIGTVTEANESGPICIAEGYATGASIHEATGHFVAVAFTAGNLEPVARALRAKHPEARLILCADNDINPGKRNVGIEVATKAAIAVDGLLAVPELDGKKCDFNDLHQAVGLNAVRTCIAGAKPAEAAQHDDAGGSNHKHSNSSSGTPEGNSASQIAYRRVSDIQAQPIRWLWPGLIARGKVSIIAGHPGLGKSQLALNIAAIVTSGGCWPVSGMHSENGSAVLLSAEDDAADTIRPRLEATDADLERCYTLDAVREYDAKGKTVLRSFNLKTDLARLEELLTEIGEVALVVIDPITAYLGGADSHKHAEIQTLLAPLGELAARYGAAVVCVTHLNKSMSTEALMRVTGSVGFVAVARAAFIVTKDLENDTRRLFLPIKNNIGNDQTGLAFTVESHQLPSGIETSRIVWEDDAVTVTADEAMAAAAPNDEHSATGKAMVWLRAVLSDGPLKAVEIQLQARESGIRDKALRRAREKLGIKPKKLTFDGGWWWELPGDEDVQGAPHEK